MNSISLPRPTGAREIRLDESIAEAESLGRVEMKQALFESDWSCEIMFRNRNGSLIFAKGKDRSLVVALGKCINEARELGAGVVS